MSEQLFEKLTDLVEDDEQLNQIESLCVECGENGTTKLLLTQIPHFKQVVVISFECPHCGNTNNELQDAQRIEEKAVRYEVKCTSQKVYTFTMFCLIIKLIVLSFSGFDATSGEDSVGSHTNTRNRFRSDQTISTYHYH